MEIKSGLLCSLRSCVALLYGRSLCVYSVIPQAEIDGRYPHFCKLKEHGDTLLQQKHFASADIRSRLSQLDMVWRSLNETCDDRKQMLTQCYDLQVSQDFRVCYEVVSTSSSCVTVDSSPILL